MKTYTMVAVSTLGVWLAGLADVQAETSQNLIELTTPTATQYAERTREGPIDRATVLDLRQLAIESGKASSSTSKKPEPSAADLKAERDAIERHRIAFFGRAYGEKPTAFAELTGPGFDRHPPVAAQYAELSRYGADRHPPLATQFAGLDRQEPIQMVLRFGTENDDFALTPKTLRFEKGKQYRLLIKNPSRVTHYISAPKFGAAIGSRSLMQSVALNPNDQHLWNFVADQEGAYDIRCGIETHAEAGMVGKIIVN